MKPSFLRATVRAHYTGYCDCYGAPPFFAGTDGGLGVDLLYLSGCMARVCVHADEGHLPVLLLLWVRGPSVRGAVDILEKNASLYDYYTQPIALFVNRTIYEVIWGWDDPLLEFGEANNTSLTASRATHLRTSPTTSRVLHSWPHHWKPHSVPWPAR